MTVSGQLWLQPSVLGPGPSGVLKDPSVSRAHGACSQESRYHANSSAGT